MNGSIKVLLLQIIFFVFVSKIQLSYGNNIEIRKYDKYRVRQADPDPPDAADPDPPDAADPDPPDAADPDPPDVADPDPPDVADPDPDKTEAPDANATTAANGVDETPDKGSEAQSLVMVVTPHGMCTGVVVADGWILTAAHCVVDRKLKETINANEVEFITTVPTNKVVTKHEVEKLFAHPDFNTVHLYHDIALIKASGTAFMADVKKAPIQTKAFEATNGSIGGHSRDKMTVRHDCTISEYYSRVDYTKRTIIYDLITYPAAAAVGKNACPCIDHLECVKLICIEPKRACQFCVGSLSAVMFCGGELHAIASHIVDCRICDVNYPASECEQQLIYRTFTPVCLYFKWMKDKAPLIPADGKFPCFYDPCGDCEVGSANNKKSLPITLLISFNFLIIFYIVLLNYVT